MKNILKIITVLLSMAVCSLLTAETNSQLDQKNWITLLKEFTREANSKEFFRLVTQDHNDGSFDQEPLNIIKQLAFSKKAPEFLESAARGFVNEWNVSYNKRACSMGHISSADRFNCQFKCRITKASLVLLDAIKKAIEGIQSNRNNQFAITKQINGWIEYFAPVSEENAFPCDYTCELQKVITMIEANKKNMENFQKDCTSVYTLKTK